MFVLYRVPRTSLLQSVASIRVDSDDDDQGYIASVGNDYKVDTPPTSSSSPCCKALYDFDSETEQELSFKEGDTIMLNNQLDDNWYEGTVNGKSGMFPVAYVQVLVPL
ncbi:Endophilin-A-like isoform X1 [Oopsacas minuta]|uniref:Endophilin-A-like isoform X1 n=1 Tax=Oopsacas minuta TaxID=111878 RepID=A0AAV7JQ28_9METZ|nr:Endophilin-A-like isoform X1 [Oopsacas minuta]